MTTRRRCRATSVKWMSTSAGRPVMMMMMMNGRERQFCINLSQLQAAPASVPLVNISLAPLQLAHTTRQQSGAIETPIRGHLAVAAFVQAAERARI
jgi:hypothetical protein